MAERDEAKLTTIAGFLSILRMKHLVKDAGSFIRDRVETQGIQISSADIDEAERRGYPNEDWGEEKQELRRILGL